MKKLLTPCLVFISITQLFAYDAKIDGIYYNLNSTDRTAEVTYSDYNNYYSDYSGSVMIPASITYYPQSYSVTKIGELAFYNCNKLTSVTIPNSVTSIGDLAFLSCSSLKSVEMDNSVTTIGGYAFEKCGSLTSITIPSSVTSIGDGAFYGCSGLTSVTIPNSVTTIGQYTFSGCTSLKSVIIDGAVTTIGESAFENCSSLTSVTIPNSVSTIGQNAFCSCSSLKSITIGNSITTIGESAFENCSNLISITCYAVIPPIIESDTYKNVRKAIPLYVPKGSKIWYQNDTYWKEFLNIQEIDNTAIEDIVKDNNAPKCKFVIQNTLRIFRTGKLYNALGGVMR